MRRFAGCILLLAGCAEEPELDFERVELVLAIGDIPQIIGFDDAGGRMSVLRRGSESSCSPRWSPDGRFFTVVACEDDDEALLVSFPDREIEVLGRDLHPRWSPTRGTLLVGDEEAYELDPETLESSALGLRAGRIRAWSPARDELAIVDEGTLVVHDLALGEPVAMVDLEVEFDWGIAVPDFTALHWSPQGDALVGQAGLRLLFVLRPDAQMIETWTLPEWTDNDLVYDVDWGPDGRVAVSRYGPGGPRVEIYDAPLGMLVDTVESASRPVWSDDGRLAVVTGNELQVLTAELTFSWGRRVEAPQALAWRPSG